MNNARRPEQPAGGQRPSTAETHEKAPPAGAAPAEDTRPVRASAGTGAEPAEDKAPAPATEPAGRQPGSGVGVGVGRLAATVERLRRKVEEAHAAADGRALVELAKGVLIERLRCGPGEAARQFAALAEEAGLSQLELAAHIVDEVARDRRDEASRDFLLRTGAERPSPGAEELSAVVRLRTAESGALAADDSQAVAESLLEHALTPLGATAVAVWSAGADASLTLAGYAGFIPEEAARWHYVPPGVATPARQAVTRRSAVWYRSLSQVGLPSIGRRDAPDGGRVAVPAGAGGRVVGVLEICWPTPLEPQPPQVQRQIAALADLCARTLETSPAAPAGLARPEQESTELVDLTDGLLDPAMVLRPHLDADGRLADFRIQHTNVSFVDPAGRPRSAVTGALFLEAYPMEGGSGGLLEKIEHVHATGEPFRAERITLTSLVDQVPLRVAATISVSRHGDDVLLVWRIQDEAARLASLLQHAQRLGRIGGFEENITTGEITWNSELFSLYGLARTAVPIPLEELAAHAHPDDNDTIGRFLRTLLYHRRPASTVFRLKRPDGIVRHIRVVAEPVLDADGHPQAVRGAYQDISAQYWTEVALAATRDQLAHTEERAAERNRLALQLQHAIMPPTRDPFDAHGLRIAVRYRPAEKDNLVGGDWYDTVTLPSKQILLCVGDVAGHGIEAATGMVVLRNALRGLAATGAAPDQLLTWLNTVTYHLTEHVTATVICGLYDPRTRVLRWARAGHLPPVLVRGGKATTLPALAGILLGAMSDAGYAEGQLQLEAGDTLLMYTDGLIERKDRTLQHSLDQLLVTAQVPALALEQRLDHLLTRSNADTDDDTCIIGVQLPMADGT